MRHRISIFEDGTANIGGVENPSGTHVHQLSHSGILVLKVPGHKYWSARATQSYAGAELQVYRIESLISTGFCTEVWAERMLVFGSRGLRAIQRGAQSGVASCLT